MSVKYSWSRQNGAAVPPVRFMSIEPAEDYYKGMPLKLKEKGIVEPTDGDPEYICMAQYDPDAEIQPLEIPVQEVFPDVIYEKINNDGTTEEVRFGSRGGGGGIKTVNGQAPDANGNVEVTAGVQSDMYETDPESMAFVKNNPIESGVVELAFDGTLEGKEYKEVSREGVSAYYVKMSNDVPAMDDLVSFHEFYLGSGEEINREVMNEDIGSNDSVTGYVVSSGFAIVEEVSTDSETGVQLDPGVWFLLIDASILGGTGLIGGLGLTYKANKVKASLIPTHSHKWNDISDAPFYDRSKSEPLNITWDGDVSGKEFVEGFVKVSDAILSPEMLLGSSVTLFSPEESLQFEITSENIMDGTSQGVPVAYGMYNETPVVWFIQDDFSADGITLTAGVWFAVMSDTAYVKSISNPNVTITTTEIKKLDPKFYDQPC